MHLLDQLDFCHPDLPKIADAQCSGDQAGRGTGYAIGDEAQVVRRMFARQPFVDLFADVLAQDAAGQGLALVQVHVMCMQGPEMHQFHGQLVMVLQGMDQRSWVDAEGMHLLEHQAQELGVAGQQCMLVGRPGNEIVGQVGTASGHLRDVVEGQVQFLEAETAGLADHAADQLVADDRQRVAFRPGSAAGAGLHAEKAVGIQAQAARTQAVQGVQGIANDHLLGGEGRVQPVQRRLAFLEIVKVHPASGLAIHTGHRRCGAPVGFLHAWFEEDHPLQLADDVVAGLEFVALGRQQVDRISPGRHFGQ